LRSYRSLRSRRLRLLRSFRSLRAGRSGRSRFSRTFTTVITPSSSMVSPGVTPSPLRDGDDGDVLRLHLLRNPLRQIPLLNSHRCFLCLHPQQNLACGDHGHHDGDDGCDYRVLQNLLLRYLLLQAFFNLDCFFLRSNLLTRLAI
jgi:hypothetical protein